MIINTMPIEELISSLSNEGINVTDDKELIYEYVDDVLSELNLVQDNMETYTIDKHQCTLKEDVYSIKKVFKLDCGKKIPLDYDEYLPQALMLKQYPKGQLYFVQANILYTSFYSGEIVLKYKLRPYNNNKLVIPDNVHVKKAIKYYIKMNLLEVKKYESNFKYVDLYTLYTASMKKVNDAYEGLNMDELVSNLKYLNGIN